MSILKRLFCRHCWTKEEVKFTVGSTYPYRYVYKEVRKCQLCGKQVIKPINNK